EILEPELLADGIALERPSTERFDPLLRLTKRKPRHDHQPPSSGLRARTSSSVTRAASTAARASRCSSIAVGPSIGLANALPAIVRWYARCACCSASSAAVCSDCHS